jgi:hypothetical protein
MSHSNKNKGPRAYPNIGDIIARKARGRHEIALMSFGQKIRMLDAMQAQVGPISKAREARLLASTRPVSTVTASK